MSRTEWIAWTPIVIGIVVFGFFPGLIFDVTNPAITAIAAAVGGN